MPPEVEDPREFDRPAVFPAQPTTGPEAFRNATKGTWSDGSLQYPKPQ